MKCRQLKFMSMSNNEVDVINLTMIRIKDVRVYTTYVTRLREMALSVLLL